MPDKLCKLNLTILADLKTLSTPKILFVILADKEEILSPATPDIEADIVNRIVENDGQPLVIFHMPSGYKAPGEQRTKELIELARRTKELITLVWE